MIPPRSVYQFPAQKVSASTKSKAEWYANCIDFIIDAGISLNDRTDAEMKLSILHGDVPNEFYKKTLNPYNSNNEKYTRFPATMRNLDIMNDVVRRYVSEYYKGVHEFVVGANNPDIVINKNLKLRQELSKMAQELFLQQFQQKYQQATQEAIQQGQDPEQIDPQSLMPDIETFIKDFNENYIDDQSVQGQEMLNYIRSFTKDILIYMAAWFNYVALGECYSYTDIRGDKIFKENVSVIEAYPIPNSEFFVEDHDMFARKMLMSYNQIMDAFEPYLTKQDKKFLEDYYGYRSVQGSTKLLSYNQYFETYPDVCEKFTKEERSLFKKQPVTVTENNNNLFEVWHTVWKGEAREGILTFVDEQGMEQQRVVEEGYSMNPEQGDISLEWVYVPTVYEGYRIGTRTTAIYPIKARAIPYSRKGKLPYNGIMEVLPTMGKFSIVDIITPFQILRNIISYHREMVIAKNKMLILLMPQSLISDDAEDRIYKMAADGVLYYDDDEDTNSLKAQQIRLLNANLGDYITQLTNLIESIKYEARELVDMNQQRYGEISQYAGKTTTEEAISRSSMGSIIIMTMFDLFRCADYNRDLDYAKLAYIDGLDTSYFDETNKHRYISLDVESFLNADYSTIVKNNSKELEKIQELKQWAFSAAQNGDLDMALAAITGDNVSAIKKTVGKFMEIKRQHEEQMKQAEQMIEQQKLQTELQKIQAKGEQDRLTEELKYQYELQLKYVDVDLSALAPGDDTNKIKAEISRNSEEIRANIEREKLSLERQKIQADMYSKAADREVKREDIRTKLKIAKENKNKYDIK